MVGCSREQLRDHLERQFTEGMAWNNYGAGKGKWSLDHIRPCASFRLGEFVEDCACFHYRNLRPLWFCDNSSKGARPLPSP